MIVVDKENGNIRINDVTRGRDLTFASGGSMSMIRENNQVFISRVVGYKN